MYYINARDLKCKTLSFEEIIRTTKPTVIAITETHMYEDYKFQLQGYAEPFRNDRNQDGGGVMLLVKEELKHISVEVKRTSEHLESLWILINNEKVKLRIGVVYFPQEQDQDLKEIYKIIKDQVQESGKQDESVIIVGDFNCKIGKEIEENNHLVTKGGRKLKKFVEKEGLKIINSLENCSGVWTREEKGVKSILDYVIADKELAEHITEMKVHDKDKDISPFNLKRINSKKIKMVYSDHNPIVIKTDLILMSIQTMEKRKRTVMTKEGREKYKLDLQKEGVSNIFNETGDIEEVYEKWESKVMEIRKNNETVRKLTEKRRSKTMRLLLKEKKMIKKELAEQKTEENMEKLNQIKEQVMQEEAESYYRRLKKTCEEIKVNGKFSSGGFWKLVKRMKRKKDEAPHAVLAKDGKKLITDNQEILKRYGEYYEELLTTTNRKAELPENQEIVQKTEEKFRQIMEEAKKQEPKKTERDMVQQIIKELKRGKARDCQDWNYEMIKDGGEEMVQSITKMADKVKSNMKIPSKWNQMSIKSIHKKGEKVDLNNKRGLFKTNINSKVFEKVQDQESEVKYDKSNNGGQKGRGTIDNWIVLMALVDEGKRLKKPVYIFFADLVKCFDRLWLRDCIVDLHE